MRKTIYTALAAALLCTTGCDDFLDTESYTEKNAGNFPVNETDATQMVTSVYATMNLALLGGGSQSTYFFVSELASDDRFGGGGENDKHFMACDHLMYNGDSPFTSFWSARYQGINRANMALVGLENLENEELRNQKKGEALFLRAMFYFELTQMFENVPLIAAAPSNVSEAQNAPKQMPADSIYAHIASDLKTASSIMPAHKWNEVASGTATRWAAQALLARVFLFYTGFYGKEALPLAEGGTLTKAEVVAGLDDCISRSGHQLLADFRSLWPYSNEITKKTYPYATNAPSWPKDGTNKEVVFALKFSYLPVWITEKIGFSNQYALYFGIRNNSRPDRYENTYPFGEGWGAGPVAPNLWNDWKTAEPTDIRREASIMEANSEYEYGADMQMEETGLWQKKIVATLAKDGDKVYKSFSAHPTMYGDGSTLGDYQTSHASDLTLIRYADVLLMHSELTGTNTGLNQVRARVNLPGVPYSLDNLKKERRHELAFEGVRWGDIRRWHDAETALAEQTGQEIHNRGTSLLMREQGAGYVARYQATKGFFPLPEAEILLSNGALKQNPGWDVSALFSAWN